MNDDTNKVNNDAPKALVNAAASGHLVIINLLLEKGDCPNVVNKSGWTPLMYASVKAYAEIVKVLLDAGANPKMERDGWTALSMAESRLKYAKTAELQEAYKYIICLLKAAMEK